MRNFFDRNPLAIYNFRHHQNLREKTHASIGGEFFRPNPLTVFHHLHHQNPTRNESIYG